MSAASPVDGSPPDGAGQDVSPSPPATTLTPATPPEAAAAVREDQIENAIAFLTHPKVRDSPTATKRSFLERKGLTAAEIDEAFRRVPSPSATASPTPLPAPAPAAAGSGLITYQPTTQQPSTYTAAAPATQPAYQVQAHTLPPGSQHAGAIVPVQPQPPPQPEPLRWSQVMLGVGVLAAGVYAVKTVLFPFAHDWYTSWVEKSKAQREAVEKQAAALQEAVQALQACQAEIRSTNQTMNTLVTTLSEQAKAHQTATQASELAQERRSHQLSSDVAELKDAVYSALGTLRSGQALSKPNATLGSIFGEDRGAHRPASPYRGNGASNGNGHVSNDEAYDDSWSAYVGGSGYGNNRSGNGRQNGGFEGGNGWARDVSGGRQSPGVQAGAGGSGEAGRGSSWLGSPARGPDWASPGAAQRPGGEQQGGTAGVTDNNGRSRPATPPGGAPPHPPSFMEVMEMVSKGITPPNVRTDIQDTPPDPTRPLPESSAPIAPKPWQQAQSSNQPQQGQVQQGYQQVLAQQQDVPQGQVAAPGSYLLGGGGGSGGQQAGGGPPAYSSGYPPASHGTASFSANVRSNAPWLSAQGSFRRDSDTSGGGGDAPVATSMLPDEAQVAVEAVGGAVEGGWDGEPQRAIGGGMGTYSSIFGGMAGGGQMGGRSGGVPGAGLVQAKSTWKPPPPPQPTLPRNKSNSSITSTASAGAAAPGAGVSSPAVVTGGDGGGSGVAEPQSQPQQGGLGMGMAGGEGLEAAAPAAVAVQ